MRKLQSTQKHNLNAENSAMKLVTDLLKAYGLRLEGKTTKWDVLVVVCCRLPGKSRLVKPTLRLCTCTHSKGKTKEHVGLMMNTAGDLATQDTEKGYLKLCLRVYWSDLISDAPDPCAKQHHFRGEQ